MYFDELGIFDPKTLKMKSLTFFCTQAWLKYKIPNVEAGLPKGSINYNTILQLDLFCPKEGKWSQV